MLVRLVGDVAKNVTWASIEAWVTVKKSPLRVGRASGFVAGKHERVWLMVTATGMMPRTYSGEPARNRV